MALYVPEWLELSKQRAIENGYEPFEDPEAYGGEVFVKDDRLNIRTAYKIAGTFSQK